MELVLQKSFEDNTVWNFNYVKTWFNQETYVLPIYCPCGKTHKPWLEKEYSLWIIEADLGEIGLFHKTKFIARAPFFDHIQQKATCGSLIHYGLMQYVHILYPNVVKTPKKGIKSIYKYQVTWNKFQNILH